MIRRSPPAAALAVLAALVVAGCGGGDGADGANGVVPTSAPLTGEQASLLADVLFDNLDAGGATFTISARTAAGDTMALTGEVDWVGHTGRADVAATGPEVDLAEVVWTEEVILERRPALLADLAFEYVARAPSPATRTIDRLVAVVAALAGEQRDNPLLIQQTPGSASFGVQELGGRAVEVLRYGDENRYWLDAETGDLVRFEQPPSTDRDAFVLDLTARGPQVVTLPPIDATIPATDLGDRYPFD